VWSEYLGKKGYRIELLSDPGNDALSKYEVGKLRELAGRYAEKNVWDMVEIVHAFDEWQENDPGKPSKPIPFEDLLEAIGRSDDREAIFQDARNQAAFDRVFAEDP
jgi:hypothetical protein